LQIKIKIKLKTLETNDYPETDHPSIEDIIDDSMNIVTIESFVYPETQHPATEDIIDS
jgi:hypothetical protein